MNTVVYLEIKKSIFLEQGVDSFSVLCNIVTKDDSDFGIKPEKRYYRTVFVIGVKELNAQIDRFLDLIDKQSNIFLFSANITDFNRQIISNRLQNRGLGHLALTDITAEIQDFLKDYIVLSFENYAQIIEKYLVLKKVYDLGLNKDRISVIITLNNFSINYTLFYIKDGIVQNLNKSVEISYFNAGDLRICLLRIYNILYKLGISINNASYLVLNNKIADIIRSISEIRNIYTIFQCTRLQKLKDINSPDLLLHLYSISVDKNELDSVKIYEFLRQNNDSLNLVLNDSGWYVSESGSIATDFSKEVYILENTNNCKFGIILDCEGDSDGSCRELGGLFYCVKNSHLHKLDAFDSDVNTIQDTIKIIIDQYKQITGRYIPSKGVTILTFGGSDENMILNSLKGNSNKHLRRQVENTFRFKDIRGVIYEYLSDNHIEPKDLSLSSVAEALNVKVVSPKHNALNDSKTLFNVLKHIDLDDVLQL